MKENDLTSLLTFVRERRPAVDYQRARMPLGFSGFLEDNKWVFCAHARDTLGYEDQGDTAGFMTSFRPVDIFFMD